MRRRLEALKLPPSLEPSDSWQQLPKLLQWIGIAVLSVVLCRLLQRVSVSLMESNDCYQAVQKLRESIYVLGLSVTDSLSFVIGLVNCTKPLNHSIRYCMESLSDSCQQSI